jgi:Flp pilus assembly protein protease CpaA
MYSYVFLFIVAFIALVFAVVQDLRTREIANWLNFSLLSIGLAYRGFYGLINNDLNFFVYGLIGTGLFVSLAYVLYYSKAFAGGDAKLLIGLGPFIPFESFDRGLMIGLGFVFALFLLGSFYSIGYTLFLVSRQPQKYKKAFLSEIRSLPYLFIGGFVIGLVGFLLLMSSSLVYSSLFLVVFLLAPLVFIHTRAIEKGCLIVLTSPYLLTEGDWLERDVRVRGKVIKKSVHGLSLEDIALLRKVHKKVWIKQGVPFSPAFLFAFIAMVFYVLS